LIQPEHSNRRRNKSYRINAFTVTLPDDTCFQPFGGG